MGEPGWCVRTQPSGDRMVAPCCFIWQLAGWLNLFIFSFDFGEELFYRGRMRRFFALILLGQSFPLAQPDTASSQAQP